MSIVDYIKLNNGKIWGVGNNILNYIANWFSVDDQLEKIDTACVIIPIDQIEGMSDISIGEGVRCLIHAAKIIKLTESASFISESYHIYCDLEVLIEYKKEFMEFENENKIIKNAIQMLDKIIEKKKGILAEQKIRDEAKQTAKEKRKYISNNYDKIFLELGRRDGFHCAVCKSTENLQIDHKTPLVLKGTNDLENLQLLCAKCNNKKRDLVPANHPIYKEIKKIFDTIDLNDLSRHSANNKFKQKPRESGL